jgi:hypothetical protein
VSDPAARDPLDDLRRANPVATNDLPSASLARVEARVQEELLHGSRKDRRSRWSRAAPIGAGLAVAAVAVVALLVGGSLRQPIAAPPSGGLGLGLCVEHYSSEALARRSIAFDGTVTAIAGDDVTFQLNRTFRGPGASSISLAAPGMTGSTVTSAGGPSFEIGSRYLVAGEDHLVWACGFSQPYDTNVAAEWASVFGT